MRISLFDHLKLSKSTDYCQRFKREEVKLQWRIQGRGPASPLFLDEPEARTAKTIFFGDRSPPPPTPYIKVWTLHWTVMILALEALVKNFKELKLFGCTQQAIITRTGFASSKS